MDAKGCTLRTDESALWALPFLQKPQTGRFIKSLGESPMRNDKKTKGSTLRPDESARWACCSLQAPTGQFTKPLGASPMNPP
jgi:hypothetical protein